MSRVNAPSAIRNQVTPSSSRTIGATSTGTRRTVAGTCRVIANSNTSRTAKLTPGIDQGAEDGDPGERFGREDRFLDEPGMLVQQAGRAQEQLDEQVEHRDAAEDDQGPGPERSRMLLRPGHHDDAREHHRVDEHLEYRRGHRPQPSESRSPKARREFAEQDRLDQLPELPSPRYRRNQEHLGPLPSRAEADFPGLYGRRSRAEEAEASVRPHARSQSIRPGAEPAPAERRRPGPRPRRGTESTRSPHARSARHPLIVSPGRVNAAAAWPPQRGGPSQAAPHCFVTQTLPYPRSLGDPFISGVCRGLDP